MRPAFAVTRGPSFDSPAVPAAQDEVKPNEVLILSRARRARVEGGMRVKAGWP